ncbi:MAG: O-antigen ligase family protein [Thermoanaerobaculia bacterium]
MRVSFYVLLAIAAVALLVALAAPLHYLLILNILLVPFQGQMQIAGVLLDPTDVVFAALAVGFTLRRRISFREIRRQVPYFWIWVALGILMSIAYLTAPLYQRHLTALHRAIYQVYRSAWKPILYFPLAALLLNSTSRSRQALTAVVLAGDICALMAIREGLLGMKAEGPFSSANSLGAALVVPFVISFGGLISRNSVKWRWFCGISLLLLVRALLYAGSRGAIAGSTAGVAAVLWLLFSQAKGRARLLRLVPAALVALLLLLAIKPDVMDRPTVRRAFTISNPMEESTMQWRINNRWGFFWEKALRSPWFGYGVDIDDTLTKGGARTPHNGYLSLLVTYGFPATALYLFLGGVGLWGGWRSYRGSRLTEISTHGLVIAAGLTGILTHNIAESVFTNTDWVNSIYWLLAGLGASALVGSAGTPRVASNSDREATNDEVGTDLAA